ncbi:hypothetical protein B296_00056239, partial [Ensete ventricosum]
EEQRAGNKFLPLLLLPLLLSPSIDDRWSISTVPPGSGRFAYRSADGLVRTARSTGRYHVTVNWRTGTYACSGITVGLAALVWLAFVTAGGGLQVQTHSQTVGVAHEERGSEQDEREVGYSPQVEEAPSREPTRKKSHKERLTMAETHLDILEASLEELYQG